MLGKRPYHETVICCYICQNDTERGDRYVVRKPNKTPAYICNTCQPAVRELCGVVLGQKLAPEFDEGAPRPPEADWDNQFKDIKYKLTKVYGLGNPVPPS